MEVGQGPNWGCSSKEKKEKLLAAYRTTKLEEHSLAGCPQFLIHYTCTYLPYLEPVSFIPHPRARHAVVTSDPLNLVAASNN
jgi:hypothetical protein